MKRVELDPGSALSGERGLPAVARSLSMQSRASHLLAIGLVGVMAVAFLGWYYTHALRRPERARQSTQAGLVEKARTEMPLPPLGELPMPDGISRTPEEPIATVANLPQAPLDDSVARVIPAAVGNPSPVTASRPTSLERRLSGAAFTSAGGAGPSAGTMLSAMSPLTAALGQAAPPAQGALATLLSPSEVHPASAMLLTTPRLLLPKGAFIDCTLETAIDSTLPGLTTCVTSTDTFSADGKVVLLERGTKLVGETRGQVQQGSARVFVLWTEARTPTGVTVPLDSPGADELGRSGLPGEVDRHFWARFGAAILISTIDGAVQAAVQSGNRSSGTLIYNPSGTQDVLTEVLKNTLNISPSVIKHNGDRIQILVARDVDFSHVYELRRAEH
jgi:type IV secretion system protein VirB10